MKKERKKEIGINKNLLLSRLAKKKILVNVENASNGRPKYCFF